jgi:hypothetical protein
MRRKGYKDEKGWGGGEVGVEGGVDEEGGGLLFECKSSGTGVTNAVSLPDPPPPPTILYF